MMMMVVVHFYIAWLWPFLLADTFSIYVLVDTVDDDDDDGVHFYIAWLCPFLLADTFSISVLVDTVDDDDVHVYSACVHSK